MLSTITRGDVTSTTGRPVPDLSSASADQAPSSEAALGRLLGRSCPTFLPGHVWLAGAGPGDRGHLTLHALCGLVQADVVVYDALVDPGVLELARRDAVREFAGKRGGRPSPHQSDISARLVELAREGRRVLRLKGGDPYVFGRGAEEALALAAAAVPFRTIPGLTAGLAGLAVAGIPATARGVNQAIVLATGHNAEGEADPVPDLDWEAVARLDQPVVLYMAIRNLPAIASRLLAAGMAADTPAAAISRAATAEQRVLRATLGTLALALEHERLPTPALVVIGRIVSFGEILSTEVPNPIALGRDALRTLGISIDVDPGRDP